MLDGLQYLAELIDRLNTTPVQSRDEARKKSKEFSQATWERMIETGENYGQASGWLSILGKDIREAMETRNRIKDDLTGQIRVFDHILDYWFKHGEPVAPGYPMRIAIISRKQKRGDLETDFLRSYGRHFLSHRYGAASDNLNERIKRVLGEIETDQLRAISLGEAG